MVKFVGMYLLIGIVALVFTLYAIELWIIINAYRKGEDVERHLNKCADIITGQTNINDLIDDTLGTKEGRFRIFIRVMLNIMLWPITYATILSRIPKVHAYLIETKKSS